MSFIGRRRDRPSEVPPYLIVHLRSFDVSVTTTPQPIRTSKTVSSGAVLLADALNTDTIYVGDSDGQTFPLEAGASMISLVYDLQVIYVRAASGTQTLHVAYEV